MDVKHRWRIWFGLAAGLGFGLLDILPMLMLEFPNRTAAMSGAFASRFAIGFLIPQVMLPLPAWTRGLLVALLIQHAGRDPIIQAPTRRSSRQALSVVC
jgi:hypothetical protein